MTLRKLIVPLTTGWLAVLAGGAATAHASRPPTRQEAARGSDELHQLRMLQAEYQTAIVRNDVTAIRALDQRIADVIEEEMARAPQPPSDTRTTDAEMSGTGGSGVDLAAMRAELEGLLGMTDQTSLDRKASMLSVLADQAQAASDRETRRQEARDAWEERRDRLLRE